VGGFARSHATDSPRLLGAPEAILHAGDSLRLQVAPGSDGYLYLFRHADSGWNMISGQPVERAATYVLPANGGIESEHPARVELLLVLAPEGEALGDVGLLASTAEVQPRMAVVKVGLDFR